MTTDATVPQGGDDRRRSQQMSLAQGRPPTEVPGYVPERLLGVGAYGEVWVAVEKNTGRRVAIKFYAHRGGLDWSLLSREVEKLAFLFADRYVVQLIGVGWDAEPPYYVMEYLEQGSLAQRLQEGPMPVADAVEVFRDTAIGLLHAHGKGVLHCDLKPGNVLLDQDHKPRLADFGQSRLSHEQSPALGTLFYMAPEQADLDAMPDARWDVYALGALLYCMLTGSPPHRSAETVRRLEQTADLKKRLSQYRRMIRADKPPADHRAVPGVDRGLAEIVDRCLAPDPARRYANVQSVLAALDARAAQRSMRPMKVLGAVGPVLLLTVVSLFAWQGFGKLIGDSAEALTTSRLKGDEFAVLSVAQNATNELERRFEAVQQVASSERLHAAIAQCVQQPEMQQLLADLSDPAPLADPESEKAILDPLREAFRQSELRGRLQAEFDALIPERMRPGPGENDLEEVASWFYCDAKGISTVRVPESLTIGKNYAWRSFFHGGPRDYDETWRPADGGEGSGLRVDGSGSRDQGAEFPIPESPIPNPQSLLQKTQLSVVFRSQATGQWIVAVSTPVFDRSEERRFLGVVALTVKVGRFVSFDTADGGRQFAVLVDHRPGDYEGVILQHPLYDKLIAAKGRLPDRFEDYRLTPSDLPDRDETMRRYRDPLAADPEGGEYDCHWLARMAPVKVHGRPTGWVVIVQEAYEGAIGSTLSGLRAGMVKYGVAALAMVVLLLGGLWALAIRMIRETSPVRLTRMAAESEQATPNPTPASTPDAVTEPMREENPK
jgi:hypothetical protein